jgi:uncharacterized delta-60 repeat protein
MSKWLFKRFGSSQPGGRDKFCKKVTVDSSIYCNQSHFGVVMEVRAIMKKHSPAAMESLEVRQLLAQIGPDISFADGGIAMANGGILLKSLANGETISISRLGSFGITKLQADGTLDTSFGNHGVVAIGQRFTINSAAVTLNHIFIIGSSADHPGNQLLAFNITNGAFDKSFGGGDGKESIPIKQPGGGLSIASGGESLNPTPDGGVLITAGLTLSNNQTQAQFIKLRSDGSVDTNFAAQGYIQINGVNATPAIWTSSGIVYATDDENGNARMFRYRTTGLSDTTFGTQGVVNVGSMFGPQVVEEPNGQLLVVGEDPDVSEATLVKRFNANGLADLGFGSNGTATLVDHDAKSPAQQLAVDPNNDIVVLSDTTISRLTSAGQLDTTFNDTGTFVLSSAHAESDTLTVTTDSMGRVLFGGSITVTRLDTAAAVKVGANHILYVNGTAADDTIVITASGSLIQVFFNGQPSTFDSSDVDGFSVNAGDGNNKIVISIAKNATIASGTGNDTIIAASGDDSVNSGGGDDSVVTDNGNDFIDLGSGNSMVSTGDGKDTVIGKTGNFQIVGGQKGFKRISFGAGASSVHLGIGGSSITDLGTPGNAHILISGGDNTVSLDNASDNVITVHGSGKNTISTGVGHNTITTGDGDDTINTQGADNISTAGGNDLIFGVNSGQTRTVVVNSGSGNDTIATGNAAANINAGNGNDLIKTGNEDDTILGGGGKDTIHAAGGNDYISGGGGNDRIFGQDGDDTIVGGSGNDVLFAGAGTNTLSGQGGNDTLVGSASDVLNGGPGVNQIVIM